MKEEITEEKRIENQKFMGMYMGIISSIICAYLFGYVGAAMETESSLMNAVLSVYDQLAQFYFFYSISGKAFNGILLGLITGVFVFLANKLHDEQFGSYNIREVAGSARFMNEKEIKEYTKTYIVPEPTDLSKPFPNMIMSNRFKRPMDSRALIGNNNVLVVGGAGSGKSRFFIKPNALQMNASFVITDPSGEIIYSLGKPLKDNGYKIKIFNISDMEHSNCYNPLHYIRNEAGVNMLIDCFIKNTTDDGSKGDQFFTNAERLLYSACIFYLINHCQDESRKNFASIINMINASAVDENNPNAKSDLDCLFDALPTDSLAWKSYKAFKQAAGKTLKSIIISCVTRLQPFLTPQVANLTKTDDLDLDSLGDEKTALFIIVPQADETYEFLSSMLYSQLFETLYYKGEQQKAAGGSERMNIPVRCLMDEFANIGEIPNFPSKLSTMRKYNISATIVLQDISQIEAMYKDEWKTLVGNCSSIVFLGSQEPNTLKYFSEMLGKGTVKNRNRGLSKGKQVGSSQNFQNTARELRFADELGRMSPKKCIVFTQNMRPVQDDKYHYEQHPRYKFTADANNDYGFMYNTMPIYDNTRFSVTHILKAKSEAARAARQSIVTDPVSLVETKVKEPLTEALDQFELSSEIEEAAFASHLIELEKQLDVHLNEGIPYAKMENISPKRLIRLAKQIKHDTDLFMVFMCVDKEKKAVCIAYDKTEELYEKMKLPFIYRIERKGAFMVSVLSKHRIDEYLKKVGKNFINEERNTTISDTSLDDSDESIDVY